MIALREAAKCKGGIPLCLDGRGENLIHAHEVERREMSDAWPQKTVWNAKFELGIDDGPERNLLRAKQRFNRARQLSLKLDGSAAHIDGHHEIGAFYQVEGQGIHKSTVNENPAIEL